MKAVSEAAFRDLLNMTLKFPMLSRVFSLLVLVIVARALPAQVQIDTGMVEGTVSADSTIRVFKGIPYAAPPVGDLRWKEPQAAAAWTGVRKATEFGPRPMQPVLYSDMVFRDSGPSEDCLYLNLWTPAKSDREKLPVMVWIYGGGFQVGAGSEPRQDGENLAKKGVVVVNFNYRVGVFGFFAHPELTQESPHHASGNYALLDQIAALRWVQRNIDAFGGDPHNVTIFGESAGSESVSILMASPLTKNLFQKAIGESGAWFGTRENLPSSRMRLREGEQKGAAFAAAIGAHSLAELRSKSAEEILRAADGHEEFSKVLVDAYLLNQSVEQTFLDGKQNHVPLLAGWNADEVRVYTTFGKARPTGASYVSDVTNKYKERSEEVLRLYPGNTDDEAVRSKGDLANDVELVYPTWRWLQLQTLRSRTFEYVFNRQVPVAPGTKINGAVATAADVGAVHASEIRYVFGTFAAEPLVAWQDEDRTLSAAIMTYWTNFARRGNPNGAGVTEWPRYGAHHKYQALYLGPNLHADLEPHRERFQFWATDAFLP